MTCSPNTFVGGALSRTPAPSDPAPMNFCVDNSVNWLSFGLTNTR